MAKWTIYDRKGKALHESITEFNGDGKIVYQDTLEYSGKWMGERFLTVSIKSAYPIDFQIGDYIEYRGEKFTINYDPTVIKKARRGTYGEGFTYDSIKFNSPSNELTQMRFHDWVLSDNKLHYTSLPTFSFYAKDVDDLVDRLQACSDRWCKDNGYSKEDYWMFYTLRNNTVTGTADPRQTQTTYQRTLSRAKDVLESCGIAETSDTGKAYLKDVQSKWEKMYGVGDNYTDSRDDERYDRNISVSNQSVWDGMAMIKQQFGLNFIVRGRNVYIGAAGIPTTHLFKYGKGNGLYEVDRTADQDQAVVTKLHAYGSGDNLPTRYYADLNTEAYAEIVSVLDNNKTTNLYCRFELDVDFAIRYFTNALTQYGDNIYAVKIQVDDIIVNARAYQQTDNQHIIIYSECYAEATDADDNTDTATFGKFQNAIAAGKRVIFLSGVKRDAWPVSHITASTKNLPDNMAVNFLMLPGFPNNSLADICRAEYDKTNDVTNYYITNPSTKTEVLFYTESGNHVIKFSSDKYDPYIVSPNAETLGIKDFDISCTEENDDNGLEKVYPSIEEITDADAGIGSTGKRLDEVVKADKIDDNGVYPKNKTDEEKIPGFHIWLPDLGFDLKQAAEDAGGGDVQISMKDGFCGARTFSCPQVSQEKDGTWKLSCKRVYDSNLDLYFPYSYAKSVSGVDESMTNAYQVCKGDHYVLTGIAVSDVNYVWAASVKLLRKAIHWLCKNDYTRYVYQPKIDEIYMAREAIVAEKLGNTSLHDALMEGDILLFSDDDLKIDGKVYIDQLNIKENGNNGIPTYEVTLRNEVQVGSLQRLQNQVDSIANDVRKGNIGGGLTSPTQVAALIEAYGDEWFVSKTKDDTVKGFLTLVKGFISKAKATFEDAVEVAKNLIVGGDASVKGNSTTNGNASVGGSLTADDIHSRRYSDALDQSSGMGYHIWVNGNTSNAIFDNLSVRGKWTASVLEVMKLQYSAGNITIDGAGGEIFAVEPFGKDGESLIPTDNLITTASTGNLLSDEGKVLKEDKKEVPYSDSDVFFYRCYFKATDGEKNIMNMWHVGDQARCQTFNLSDGTHLNAQNKTYFRVVINKSDVTVLVDGTPCFYIDLSNVQNGTLTGDDGKEYNYRGLLHSKADDGTVTWLTNDAPEKGDQVAHVGNIYDEERQGAVQLVAVGAEKGLFIYDGINETLENLNDFLRVKWSPKNSLLNTTFLTYTNGYHTNNPYIICGDWRKGITSHPNEVWQHNGGSWICNKETTTEPSEGNEAWSPFAQKGEQGIQGPQGIPGNDGTSVGRNLFFGIAGYTASTPYRHSSAATDGYEATGIFTEKLDGNGGTYAFQIQSSKDIAPFHSDGQNQGMVTLWLYLCKDYSKDKGNYDQAICFTSKSYNYAKTQEGADSWVLDIPSGYTRAEIRVDTYSNGSTMQFANFWNMKLEKGDVPTAFCLNEADLKGDDGAPAETYYINPNALIVTEKLNKDDSDTDWSEKKYTSKDFEYDIPSNFSIHHSVGSNDSIIKIADDGWSCTEGVKLLPSGWTATLQRSFVDGKGYDLTSILSKSVLCQDSNVLKIVLAAKVNNAVTLNINIYINRLGTTRMETYGDTTNVLKNRTFTWTDENGKTQTTNFENYLSASSQQFNLLYKKVDSQGTSITQIQTNAEGLSTRVTTLDSKVNDIAVGEGSSKDIDLTGKDENTFYLVLFDFDPNNPDLFIFGVKKDLHHYDTRTSYGRWVNTGETYTDKGGFETYVQWQEHYSAWGARDVDRTINNYTKNWFIDSNGTYAVGSIGQYEQNGPVYIYLRGGGKYHVYSDHIGVSILLAEKSDVDKLTGTDTKPSLTLPLASVKEPIAERKAISSEITQTATSITAKVTDGLTDTGIDITNHTITAKGDSFKWTATDGTSVLYMDSNGANFSGNVSAKTLSTTSGKSKIDEDGILTAVGANIMGSVMSGSDSGKAVELNAEQGSMVIYGDGHEYRTEHTGQTFDAIDDVLPGATYTPTYNKTTYKVVTGYIRTGGSSNSVTMATLRPTATGNLTIQLSSLKVYINARAAGVEARAEILWNNNVVYRGSIMPKSAQDISSDISNEWKNLTLHVFANKGTTYELQLRVTITSYLLTELDQQTCATAEAALSNMTFSSNIYRSMFFGNGLALSQGSSNSFVAMVDSGGNAIVQGRSGIFGVRLSKDGISYMLDGNRWLPLNDGIIDTSANYSIEAGIGTVICQNTSAITITMPENPYKGQKITVIQGNNNLTFMPNGKTFRWRNEARTTVTSSHIGQKTEFFFNGTYWQVFQVNSETPY